MKQSSQRLLLSVYPPRGRVVQFPYRLVPLLVPELTPGGQRSLIHVLQKQQFLHKEQVIDELVLTLGEQGRRALEQDFPALRTPTDAWQGDWQLVVFLSPPFTDKNFRFLRKQLLAAHALPVSRGVYAFPEKIPQVIARELENSYQGAVLVVPIGDVPNFGSLRPLIMEHYQLPDLISAYSGVSSEIDELLKLNRSLERLTDSQKKVLATVMIRISEIGLQDPGIIRFYFPGAPNLKAVLAHFQHLLSELVSTS